MNTTKKFVIYRRVSTSRQFNSGLGLAAQSESVRRYLSTQPDAVVLGDFVEAETGKNDDRPILRQAVDLCRKESATLFVSKIDRLSRSLRLIMMLEQYKVPFIAADNPEMNELVCHILVALAQSERKTIATRVREALRQAKLRGIKLGGPNIAEARLLANSSPNQKGQGTKRQTPHGGSRDDGKNRIDQTCGHRPSPKPSRTSKPIGGASSRRPKFTACLKAA